MIIINPDKYSIGIGLLRIINEIQQIITHILRICNSKDVENEKMFKLSEIRKTWAEWLVIIIIIFIIYIIIIIIIIKNIITIIIRLTVIII